MKPQGRNIILIFIFVLLLSLLSACSNEVYTITYFDEEMAVYAQTFKSDELPTAYELETKEGRIFVGWYENLNDDKAYGFNETLTADITLFAKWENEQYTIIFLNDDQSVLKRNLYYYNEDIIPPVDPFKPRLGNEVYTFAGWDKTVGRATKNEIFTATYTTVYERTATFYNEEGLNIKKYVLEEGSEIPYFQYERENSGKYSYNLIGWCTEPDGDEPYDFNNPIEEDISFYPIFLEELYVIDLEGMIISFLGDSITTFYSASSPYNSYYSGTNQFYYPIYSSTVKSVQGTWWYKLAELAGLQIGINNSWSGSSVYNRGSSTNSAAMNPHRIQTLGENGSPDIIVVHMGTNDLVNGFSTDIFRTAYDTMLRNIENLYPEAFIFCCALGYSSYQGYEYTEENRIKFNGVIKELAQEHNQYIIGLDLVQTEATYSSILGDFLHPSANGMIVYAETAYEALLTQLKPEKQ